MRGAVISGAGHHRHVFCCSLDKTMVFDRFLGWAGAMLLVVAFAGACGNGSNPLGDTGPCAKGESFCATCGGRASAARDVRPSRVPQATAELSATRPSAMPAAQLAIVAPRRRRVRVSTAVAAPSVWRALVPLLPVRRETQRRPFSRRSVPERTRLRPGCRRVGRRPTAPAAKPIVRRDQKSIVP
jgi:hypothetical protein